MQLMRHFKKLQFAKVHARQSRFVLSRFHLKRILSVDEAHRSFDMNRVLKERDALVSELTDMFIYATTHSHMVLDAENMALFIQIFTHLLRFDLVWWIYDSMDSLGVMPSTRINTLVANTCADSMDGERARQVFQSVMSRNDPSLLVQTFWNALIQALCTALDPMAVQALQTMERTGTGVITFQIALALLGACESWESKMSMFKLLMNKMEVYHSYHLYVHMLYAALNQEVSLEQMVEMLEMGVGDRRLEAKLRHGKTFYELMFPVIRELVSAQSMDVKRVHAAKLFAVFEEMRSIDFAPSYEILAIILNAVAEVGSLTHMWMVYRKLTAAKFYKRAPIFTIMMEASVRHGNINSGIRVIRQVMEIRFQMPPEFYTPLLRLMSESGDRRIFSLYVALVQQGCLVKGIWEHGLILQKLFDQIASQEGSDQLMTLVKTVHDVTDITLTFPSQ